MTKIASGAARGVMVLARLATVDAASADDLRNPPRIDVPDQPRLPNTTRPLPYECTDIEDSQHQAADFCTTYNDPTGRIVFRDLHGSPRPLPIYSVICFD